MRKLVCRLIMVMLAFAVPVLIGGEAEAQKNPKMILKNMDSNDDDRIGEDEWNRNPRGFKKIDTNSDGYLTLDELSDFFGGSGRSGGAGKRAPKKAATASSNANSSGVWQGPMIDVHSQVDENTDLSSIVPMLDQAGVAKVMLSTRFRQPSSDLLELAARHPERIIPAAKTKTRAFTKGKGDYRAMFNRELGLQDYRAIAEVIMWHAAKKGVGAGKAAMDPDDPRVTMMMDASRGKSIPFIAHVEFRAMGWDKSGYLEKLEAFMEANRDVPVGMIHMGQLDAEDAARMLPKYSNLFFITSHCNPVAYKGTRQPWTHLIVDAEFAPAWKELILAYPDRFVLGFDNVFHFHWEDKFLPQVEVWRKALATLPDDIAHAIAHGNAERLWRLPPVVRP